MWYRRADEEPIGVVKASTSIPISMNWATLKDCCYHLDIHQSHQCWVNEAYQRIDTYHNDPPIDHQSEKKLDRDSEYSTPAFEDTPVES